MTSIIVHFSKGFIISEFMINEPNPVYKTYFQNFVIVQVYQIKQVVFGI